ncbi:MAG: histidine kinase [Bacteroidota bacterium]
MRNFWRYIFPLLYSILIYASIRAVHDITFGNKFWMRPWQTNAIELVVTIFLGFFELWIIDSLIFKFETSNNEVGKRFNIPTEFIIIFVTNLIILHIILVPLMILTDDGMQVEDYVIGLIIPSLYLMLYFSMVRGNHYLKNYVLQKIEIEKISNDQLQTELKFLKAQYHPHFLFNALNTIYFQMDENVEEAKKTVEKFSELLRYQLYDQQIIVPIYQEIHYLKNFIDIQKVRTSEKLDLTIYFDPCLNEQRVYPLLFLPLVENAFKYVGGDYKIKIEAKKNNDAIEFLIINSIPEKFISDKPNGIGLENLQRRLVLLYPHKHELVIQKLENNYSAFLKLNIH